MNSLVFVDSVDVFTKVNSFLSPIYQRILFITSKKFLCYSLIIEPILSLKEILKDAPNDDLSKREIIIWAVQNKCDPHIICNTIAELGYKSIMEQIDNRNYYWNEKTFAHAAKSNRLIMIKYLHENNCPWDKQTFTNAVTSNKLNIIKYLHNNKCPWDKYTFANAVKTGNIKIIKYLHEYGCPWNRETFVNAVELGDLSILDWLYEQNCPWDNDILNYMSCYTTINLEIVKWVLHKYRNSTRLDIHYYGEGMQTWYHAIKNNQIEFLKLIFDKQCNDEEGKLFDTVIENGSMECIEFMHNACNGYYGGDSIYFAAIRRGDIKILEFLKSRNYYWYSVVFSYAVKYSNLDIIEWFHKNGCPWIYEENIYCYAMKNKNKNVLNWLWENNYYLHKEDILKYTKEYKNYENIESIYKKNYTEDAYKTAIQLGNLDMILWLQEKKYVGYENNYCSIAAEYGRLDILKWLHKNGMPLGLDLYVKAASRKHVDIIKWLYENDCI